MSLILSQVGEEVKIKKITGNSYQLQDCLWQRDVWSAHHREYYCSEIEAIT